MTSNRPPLAFQDLERVYEKVAAAIDVVGPERESVLLAKLALALAHHLGDSAIVERCIDMALQDPTESTEGQS